jgi:GNAT superfamily N-acetyltransferase
MSQSEPSFSLEVIEEARMPPATDRAIRRLLCECFPADVQSYARRRVWHDSPPAYTVIARQAGLVVGHLGIVMRTVACADVRVAVAGVQSFCVVPRHRGTGLSKRLMAWALDEALRRGVRFGLLFCVPELQRLYDALGWFKTDRPVTMLDERGELMPMPGKNICMFIELGGEGFPPGPLDLQGRDW